MGGLWPSIRDRAETGVGGEGDGGGGAYQIIVADAAYAVSVNFSGRCKFLQI